MAASKSKEGMNLKSTKQELLDAYHDLEAKIEAKNEAELKPERKIQEKKAEETMSAVKDITQEKVLRDIDNLRAETGRLLGQLADKIEAEVKRLGDIQAAIALKDREIKEIYDIDRSAATLAALIEAQNIRRQDFEEEMAAKKGVHLRKRLDEMMEKYEQIGDVRGFGMLQAIEMVEDRKSKTPACKLRDAVDELCMKRGLITLGCGKSGIRVIPPIITPIEQLDSGLDVLDKAIGDAIRK